MNYILVFDTKKKKKFYMVESLSGDSYVILAWKIGDAHKKARELFGERISFKTREMTDQETMFLDPAKVIALP